MVLRILRNIKETVKIKPEPETEGLEEGYIEINAEEIKEVEPKLYVKVYFPRDFAEIRYILDDLREGYYICFINITHLRNKNKEALKHAIEKIKRTVLSPSPIPNQKRALPYVVRLFFSSLSS